jgi:hypothetical protein
MEGMEGLAEMMGQLRGMRGPAPDSPVPDR